jgi:hypothetical protein
MKNLSILFFAAVSLLTAAAYPITPNQVDNFQDGTTQNWTGGSLDPIQPSILSGGFGGSTDNFLRVVSSGSITAGGKLVFFNITQWAGNYITANIVNISMRIRNSGTTLLNLRVAFNGTAGWFVSTNPVNLNPDGVWKIISFPVNPAALTGTGDPNTTLSGVTAFRILHTSTANFTGEPIVAQLDVDDITAESLTPVEGENQNSIPYEYSLDQNYPNPFNPSTIIKYALPFESHVTLSIYNVLGKIVKELFDGVQNFGVHFINFNSEGLSSGIYFYSLHAVSANNKSNFYNTRKMTLLK